MGDKYQADKAASSGEQLKFAGVDAAAAALMEVTGLGLFLRTVLRIIRFVSGAFLVVVAILLKIFAHELHLISSDRADLFIPGVLGFVGFCLIFAKGKASTIAASIMGIVATGFLWFVVLLAFSR